MDGWMDGWMDEWTDGVCLQPLRQSHLQHPHISVCLRTIHLQAPQIGEPSTWGGMSQPHHHHLPASWSRSAHPSRPFAPDCMHGCARACVRCEWCILLQSSNTIIASGRATCDLTCRSPSHGCLKQTNCSSSCCVVCGIRRSPWLRAFPKLGEMHPLRAATENQDSLC
jgi:hypothetical protein